MSGYEFAGIIERVALVMGTGVVIELSSRTFPEINGVHIEQLEILYHEPLDSGAVSVNVRAPQEMSYNTGDGHVLPDYLSWLVNSFRGVKTKIKDEQEEMPTVEVSDNPFYTRRNRHRD